MPVQDLPLQKGPHACKFVAKWVQLNEKSWLAQKGTLDLHTRTKMDPGNDLAFYEFPRLVTHVDNNFLAQVTQLYRELIPPGQ
eukprot:scaffold12770_cov18-Tisochrysis_lutea.AAC.1